MLTKTRNKLSIRSNWDKNLNQASGAIYFGTGDDNTIETKTGQAQCPSNQSACCGGSAGGNTC